MRPETWPDRLYRQTEDNPYQTIFREFLATISRLDIDQSNIKGNIAVIGQSTAFPERALLTTPESHFEKIKPGIDLIATFDGDDLAHPKYHELSFKVIDGNPDDPVNRKNAITHYVFGAGYVLEKLPAESFQLVLAFRIVDLGDQLEAGLLPAIAQSLSHEGVFICSGGMLMKNMEYLKKFAPLEILQTVDLPNPDYSGYPFDNHLGIILQKK